MREIKFRFWNKTKKRFEDEYVAPFLYSGGQLMFSYPSNAKFSEQLEEIIPLQYINRKDKNDKDIFEGCIVKIGNCYYVMFIGLRIVTDFLNKISKG